MHALSVYAYEIISQYEMQNDSEICGYTSSWINIFLMIYLKISLRLQAKLENIQKCLHLFNVQYKARYSNRNINLK